MVFRSSDHADVKLRVKPHTKMSKLIDAWLKKYSVERGQKSFVFEGQRLKGEETPSSLGMSNGAVVDVQEAQEGGMGALRR